MNIKVSVIIPTYNVENYIEKCLNSIINQTLHEIEVIVINDGSTDKSSKIVDEISKKDSRVKLVNQDNAGVSKARNKGMMLAQGDYITFVDPDDYIEINMLEKLYMTAEKYNCDIVQCNYTIDNNGKYRPISQDIKPNKVLKEQEIVKYLKNGLIEGSLATYVWDKIFKRSYLKEHNLKFREDLNMFEDWYFIMDAISYLSKFAFLQDSLYNYRITSNSLSRKYISNHEDLIVNLQSNKLHYIERWKLNIEPYKSKYLISLYDDIFKIINYILSENYKLDKKIQLIKINSILKSKFISNSVNKNNNKLYISSTSINKFYLIPILYGIRRKKIKFIYLWVQTYKFIKKG